MFLANASGGSRAKSHASLRHQWLVRLLVAAMAFASDFPVPEGFDPHHGLGDTEYEPEEGAQMNRPGAILPTSRLPPTQPAPASQSGVRPATLGIAFAAYGLSTPLRMALLKAFECDESESPEPFATTPDREVDEILEETLIEDERPPSRIEKGHVRNFFRRLREQLLAPPAAAPVQPSGPIQVMLPDTSDRQEYKDYLDQTLRGTFTMLPHKELMAIRRNYEKWTGAPVEGDARPSDGQLSALAHRLRPQANGLLEAPFVEFAVFGPHHGRSARFRQFHDHVLTRDGTWQYRLLRGPGTFESWEACWRVFAASCIMLDVAKPGQLHQYFVGVRTFNQLFPNDWGTTAAIDEEVRSEIWPRLHQEILEGARPEPRFFDRTKPWGTIIAESRFDYLQGPLADYWRRQEVKLERGSRNKPAVRNLGAAPGAAVPPPLPAHQGAGSSRDAGWGSGGAVNQPGKLGAAAKKKARKQRQQQTFNNQRPQPQQHKGKGKGNPEKRKMPENYAGCHYCKDKTHFVRDCPKWISAGRPELQGAPRPKKAAK